MKNIGQTVNWWVSVIFLISFLVGNILAETNAAQTDKSVAYLETPAPNDGVPYAKQTQSNNSSCSNCSN